MSCSVLRIFVCMRSPAVCCEQPEGRHWTLDKRLSKMVWRASTPWQESQRLMARNIEVSDAHTFVRGYHYLRADFHRSALFFADAPRRPHLTVRPEFVDPVQHIWGILAGHLTIYQNLHVCCAHEASHISLRGSLHVFSINPFGDPAQKLQHPGDLVQSTLSGGDGG
jgi:hypothetical protein